MGSQRFIDMRRLGLLALLVVLLGQAGLLVHETTADHQADETCEVCTTYDRATGVAVTPGIVGLQIAFALVAFPVTFCICSRRFLRHQRARAPPIL